MCTGRYAAHPEHGMTFTDAENMGIFPVAEPGDGTQMNWWQKPANFWKLIQMSLIQQLA